MMCVIIMAGTALLWLRVESIWPVLFVVAVVVASDTSAYMAGRLIGGPKLAPRISPGKTRSGALGGFVGAVLMGGGIALLSGLGSTHMALVWGGILGVSAQLGDLAESAMKRALGVKDSGTLLPGHGGLLDRFDGLVVAAPVAAAVSVTVPDAPFWSAGLHDLVYSLVSGMLVSPVFGFCPAWSGLVLFFGFGKTRHENRNRSGNYRQHWLLYRGSAGAGA